MANLKTPRGYEEDFDPEWYINAYYKNLQTQIDKGGHLPFSIDSLHDIFQTGEVKGEKLLDVGTGPTVHSVISASRYVNEIHLSDLVTENRTILQKWLDGEPNVTEAFEYILKKENDKTTLENRIQTVREKVKKIYPIDLRRAEPLEGSNCKYDIIIASLCLCVVAKTIEEFQELALKLIDMLKSNGYIIIIGSLHCTFYQVGDFNFSAPNLSRDKVESVFVKAGMNIVSWREQTEGNYGQYGETDTHGFFVMVAQTVKE